MSLKIRFYANNSKGYVDCNVGGVADLNFITSKTRRGRVQGNGEISPAITVHEMELYRMSLKIIDEDGHEYFLSNPNPYPLKLDPDKYEYYIRKLTPHECWILMSFSTLDYLSAKVGGKPMARKLLAEYTQEDGSVDWIPLMERADEINYMSATQLYKQAGNSICQCVLVAIIGQLIEGKENVYKDLYKGNTPNREYLPDKESGEPKPGQSV